MLRTVAISDLLALGTEIFLERGVNDKLFSYRVTRELPAELVCPLFLLFLGGSCFVFLKKANRVRLAVDQLCYEAGINLRCSTPQALYVREKGCTVSRQSKWVAS